MPQYNRHYPIFMRAIGHPELAEDPRYYPQTNLQANVEEFYDFLVKPRWPAARSTSGAS